MNAVMNSEFSLSGQANSWRRFLPMAGIVLAHAALFYALQNGLISHVVKVIPEEVVMTFVQPEKPVTPPPAKIVEKPVSLKQPEIHLPVIPTPVVNTPVTPHSITAVVNDAPPPPKTEAPAVVSATPTPPAPATPKSVSAVEYLRPPRPEYPSLSRRMGEEGKVVMRVLVNDKGQAEKIEVHQSSGFPRLDDAARVAIMRAVFKPYHEDGKALAMIATATIHFSLDS